MSVFEALAQATKPESSHQRREIKFRGKSIMEGQWIYGSLIEFDNLLSGLPVSFIRNQDTPMTSVDVITVGQFTGLKDKNGVEIYEGDIFFEETELNDGDRREYFAVVWMPKRAMFSFLSIDEYIGYFEGHSSDEHLDPSEYYGIEPDDTPKYHRAGNIHDNPELLQ